MTARFTWTIRGELPDPSAYEDAFRRLLVGGAREFVEAYSRLRHKDDEAVLLKKLDTLARAGFWLKETFLREKLAEGTFLRESAPAVAIAFESLAHAIAELKLAVAHSEPNNQIDPDASATTARKSSTAKESTRLLAAAQMFLWTVEGAVDSTAPPAASPLQTPDESSTVSQGDDAPSR